MLNNEVEIQEHLNKAFSKLDIHEQGWDFYISLVAKSMIRRICTEASLRGVPTDVNYYDNLGYDCAQFLDFMMELKPLIEKR